MSNMKVFDSMWVTRQLFKQKLVTVMKKYIIVFFALIVSYIHAVDVVEQLIDQAVERAYSEMRQKIPMGEVLRFSPAENDIGRAFDARLAVRISAAQEFKLVDHLNLHKLFKENMEQQNRIYDNGKTPEIGVFIPAKWLIISEVMLRQNTRMFKKRYELSVKETIDKIETGEVYLKSSFLLSHTDEPPVWFFLINLGASFLALFIANRVTRGYYAGWLSAGFLLENLLVIAWQFFL